VVRTNLHAFSQILKISSRIGAPIVAPSSDDFQTCLSIGKGFSFPKESCKPHLNRPTNTDAIFSSITQLHASLVIVISAGALQTYKKTRNKSNDYFESQSVTAIPAGPVCHYPITRENTSLAINVVQKITIIRRPTQKIGKFAV